MSEQPASDVFRHPVSVRYLEVDGQGVVFHMWYLAYLDDALPAFLASRGLPYAELNAAGLDVQLVRTELDWRGSVGWQDEVEVLVATASVGRTSFTLDFEVRRSDVPVCRARTVYVLVALDGSGKRPLSEPVRAALGDATPLPPLR